MTSDIRIGDHFRCGGQVWICTDVGTRVIVAIEDKDGWTSGPPYALAETVFDENDLPACELINEPTAQT